MIANFKRSVATYESAPLFNGPERCPISKLDKSLSKFYDERKIVYYLYKLRFRKSKSNLFTNLVIVAYKEWRSTAADAWSTHCCDLILQFIEEGYCICVMWPTESSRQRPGLEAFRSYKCHRHGIDLIFLCLMRFSSSLVCVNNKVSTPCPSTFACLEDGTIIITEMKSARICKDIKTIRHWVHRRDRNSSSFHDLSRWDHLTE